MEIVLAVLLLFGGFTLGSTTTDKGDDDVRTTMALPNVEGVLGSHPDTQITHYNAPMRCHSDKSVIYRNLTVPTHGQIERTVIEVDDCEGGCPDE